MVFESNNYFAEILSMAFYSYLLFSYAAIFNRVCSPSGSSTAPVPSQNPILAREEEIDRYLALPNLPNGTDPLDFWKLNKSTFPILSKLARKFLATPCSSVYSERLFSEFGNIYEDTRSRLLPERGEKLLFLHHNYKRMYKEKQIWIPWCAWPSFSRNLYVILSHVCLGRIWWLLKPVFHLKFVSSTVQSFCLLKKILHGILSRILWNY